MVALRPRTKIARRNAIVSVAGAAVAAAWPGPARAATTVKFGSVGGLSDAGLYLADEYGFFAAAGIALDMQQLDSAPTLVQLIATNQIDVAGISVTPGLFASVPLHIGLRIVGDEELSARILRDASDRTSAAHSLSFKGTDVSQRR